MWQWFNQNRWMLDYLISTMASPACNAVIKVGSNLENTLSNTVFRQFPMRTQTTSSLFSIEPNIDIF